MRDSIWHRQRGINSLVFSSFTFIFWFLPLVLLGYYLARPAFQNYVLLAASLLFYSWGEPKFVLVLLASIAGNYGLTLWIDALQRSDRNRHARLVLTTAVLFNVVILGYFKYMNFFVDSINNFFGTEILIKKIALPLGISFYTFHALSYIFDVYRKKVEVQRNPVLLALYFVIFPQMIAGPIVRYHLIAHQLRERQVTLGIFAEGIKRFIIGLAKKVIIANNLGLVADEISRLPAADSTVALTWLGAICYTLQIYFDFSGYSDMAIGLARMFGFQFPENFNYPYISKSISEFWRRWHMTLGLWFRDYVYIPLGGNRVSRWKVIRNLSVVWALTGLWHGAEWTFVLWGVYFGVIIILEKFVLNQILTKIWTPFQHFYALFLVVIGWVIFRSESIGDVWNDLYLMFGAGQVPFFDTKTLYYLVKCWPFALLGIIGCVPVAQYISKLTRNLKDVLKGHLVDACYIGLFILSTMFLVDATFNPFIYFRF